MDFSDETFAAGKKNLKQGKAPEVKTAAADPNAVKALEGVYTQNGGNLEKIAGLMGYNLTVMKNKAPANANEFAVAAASGAYDL